MRDQLHFLRDQLHKINDKNHFSDYDIEHSEMKKGTYIFNSLKICVL